MSLRYKLTIGQKFLKYQQNLATSEFMDLSFIDII
jgi:hypothetical protein